MAKIGVFDSGRGGEFVAARLKLLRPTDTFITVNDSQNVPYGSKSPDEVRALTRSAVLPLIGATDVVLIACNTATALAIDSLRAEFPEQRFAGFEPMVKPAALKTSTGKIAVLATPATLQSERYAALKQKFAAGFEVFEPDCSSWAALIERGEFVSKNPLAASELSKICELASRESVDQVILACTHYLGIEDLLRAALPAQIKILQPLKAINQQISRLLGGSSPNSPGI